MAVAFSLTICFKETLQISQRPSRAPPYPQTLSNIKIHQAPSGRHGDENTQCLDAPIAASTTAVWAKHCMTSLSEICLRSTALIFHSNLELRLSASPI